MTMLIKDLIAIPERVSQGDFVLKLSEGVTQAEQTLRDYVVTPQLADAFKEALGFIQQSLQARASKATYLHGSFGSGKSHFMAVLNLLLAGNLSARAIPELASLVANMEWARGKRFLLVPYHMVNARDMESAVLGQYASFVRKQHPDAPVPGFYRSEKVFETAESMRAQMGDAKFFANLVEQPNALAGSGGWGDLDSAWDAARYEAARREPPHGQERVRLVGALIHSYIPAFQEIAGAGESYVDLDTGLAIMSRHAKALGYDAVILFLDELVLWLASRASDAQFVAREGTKLVKLVEAQDLERPVPLISFVARQRDLRELVGDNMTGAQHVQFSDVLKYWEARFHRIVLEDRNLPAIAERRVLRPIDETARLAIDQAFQELKLRRDVLDTLMTTQADQEMFRRVYPFSPALVQTLIAVSAALQRERTALKLMLQLLINRRDDLQLGQLIPVGDLWEALDDGDQPFSDAMRVHFDNAKKLWRTRLLPLLEAEHGVTWEQLRDGDSSPAGRALRSDARLLTTLLLAALVPEVEALKALTPARLAALNHGSFRSPIPGQETQLVLNRLRKWAAQVGEVKIGEGTNPVVSIQITGVDLEPVIKAAETNDNPGNRRKKIRELLFKQLGIGDSNELFINHGFTWRGTDRSVDIAYENVRDASDDRLRNRGEGWNIVIDYPFDEPNRTPADDLARIANYKGGSTRTLVWVPSFLSQSVLNDLGRYVVLDYILTGERFDSYAGTLSAVDRVQAKALAGNQRDALRVRIQQALEVAYGIAAEPKAALGHIVPPDQQLQSLDPTFAPRPPVGANFKEAFANLLDQLMVHRYPAHPEFEGEVKLAIVRQIWAEVRQALDTQDRRQLVTDSTMRRRIRGIVAPLKLGTVGDTHLHVLDYWKTHFLQQQARTGTEVITVQKLREWIDQPSPMGLPASLQNLLILSFAALTDRRFVHDGRTETPDVDRLTEAAQLVEQPLPSAEDWREAIDRASELFGITSAQVRNAANVGRLVDELQGRSKQHLEAVREYRQALQQAAARAQIEGPESRPRLKTADCAAKLLDALTQTRDAAAITVLARHPLETSAAAMARAMTQAAALRTALSNVHWTLFDGVRAISDERAPRAAAVLESLASALGNDEHVLGLREAVGRAERDATALLVVAPPVPPPLPPAPMPPPPPPVVSAPGVEIIEVQAETTLRAKEAGDVLAKLRERLANDQELELTLQWRLSRKRQP